MYPTYWIEFGGVYIFSIALRGAEKSSAIMDFHMVNPEDGGVSGSIPFDVLFKNKKIAELLKHPNKVSPEDQQMEHSLKISSPSLRNYEGHDYLSHYGIPGMHWGVRRYQDESGRLTPEGKERYYGNSNGGVKKSVNDGRAGMSPEAINAIAQVSVYAAFMIGLPIYYKIKRNSNHKKFKEKNDALSEDYLTDIADLKDFSDSNKPKSISGDHSVEDDMAAVNPTYGQAVKGNSSNCVLCSVTYDLRRRGYDVTAKLCSTGMYTDKVVKEMYDGVKEDKVGANSWTKVAKNIEKKYPEGSRGVITLASIFGGHAMAFEINNGKLDIIDAQSSKRRKLTDEELSYFDPSSTSTVRLDNKNVKWEGASIACAELKSDWKSTIAAKKSSENKQAEENSSSNSKIAAGARPSAMNFNQITAYKREHPNTKLTDKEIWANLRGG